ncbi:MAG: 16S rRNA (guanine(527)-N(7))-methyltransferase RsmG [Rhizobiaceae bacterium]
MLRRVAGDVSRETFMRLDLFEQRFREWNSRINLTSSADTDQIWPRHIVDSAQIPALRPRSRRWLDFGSGGGFPGAVLAIMLAETDGVTVHLVESNRKKAAFLSRIVAETGAPAQVHACRIEALHGRIDDVETITARAVADLKTLLFLARPWLEGPATALFQKGRDYRREIEDSRDAWRFDLIEHQSLTDPEAVILQIAALRAVPTG